MELRLQTCHGLLLLVLKETFVSTRLLLLKIKIHFDGESQGIVHQLRLQVEKYLAGPIGNASNLQNNYLFYFSVEIPNVVW